MGIHMAIYGSHDANVCIEPQSGVYRIYELERIRQERNYSTVNGDFRADMEELFRMIQDEYRVSKYHSCYYAQLASEHVEILKDIFDFEHFEEISHHAAHAAGAIYQCDFEKSLVISSDSGGHEMDGGIATFCIYEADKSRPMNQVLRKIANIPLDAAGAYTLMAVPIKEVYKTDVFSRYLTYAGKIMGLAAYGKVRNKWVPAIKDYYYRHVNINSLNVLGDDIGLNLSTINTISGQEAYDLAATSQYVFEEITMHAVMPYISALRLPVVLTGGAALNVVLNEKFKKSLHVPVFVPVNPNDCGLAFGMMVLRNPPLRTVDITYSGYGILDYHELSQYVLQFNATTCSRFRLAQKICRGKIIGVMTGNSEAGPRALGNRSILCDPSNADMKDILNSKVKFREWFRPFAPVVRTTEASEYFEMEGQSRFMSYAVPVQQRYRKRIPAVVHEDGTARVQTVDIMQHELLYDLLGYVKEINGCGVLLNTSFNIKGRPILTTIKDAIEVWQTTGLDAVYINGWLFEKT